MNRTSAVKTGLILALVMLIGNALAAQEDEQEEEINTEEIAQVPYEVIVTPTVTRGRLRELIVAVEDDFFARFNELNIDDAYDIVCYKYTPTMSHISERVCEPLFLMRSRNLNVSETTMLLGMTGMGARRSSNLLDPRAMRMEVEPDYRILQTKMEEFTRTDDEFRSIGNALAELKSRLENYGR